MRCIFTDSQGEERFCFGFSLVGYHPDLRYRNGLKLGVWGYWALVALNSGASLEQHFTTLIPIPCSCVGRLEQKTIIEALQSALDDSSSWQHPTLNVPGWKHRSDFQVLQPHLKSKVGASRGRQDARR